jgi:hypothetical protein
MEKDEGVPLDNIERRDERDHVQVAGTVSGSNSEVTPSTQGAHDTKSTEKQLATSIEKAYDWDGPGDADNPRNWPVSKKILHSAIPAIYGFAL